MGHYSPQQLYQNLILRKYTLLTFYTASLEDGICTGPLSGKIAQMKCEKLWWEISGLHGAL